MAKKPNGLSVARMIVSWTMNCAGCALFIVVGAVVINAFRGGLSLNVKLWTLAAAVTLSGLTAFRGREQLRQIAKPLFLVPAIVPVLCAGIFLLGSIEHGFRSNANLATIGVLVAMGFAPMAWWALLRGKQSATAPKLSSNQPATHNSPWG